MPFLALPAFWGLTWGAVIAYAVAIVGAVENSRRARSVKRRMIRDYNASLEDRLVMAATANGARSRCYGRVRNVDGVVFKGTWGAKSEMYTLVIALAGHEIDGIEQIYFDDVPVALEADGQPLSDGRQGYWVTTAPMRQSRVLTGTASIVVSGGTGSVTLPFVPISGSVSAGVQSSGGGDNESEMATPSVVGNVVTLSGVVTEGTWRVVYQYGAFFPKARVWKYLGDPGQDMSPLLASRFPSIISSTDKFQGMAALVVELQFDQDAWPTGLPSISAVIRGAKVYDQRTGLTAWTENPALIARDWALYANGGGCELSHIAEASFTAAANACDVSTEFDTIDGPVLRPLYQCGIVCRLDGDADDSFDEIVESMAGKWGWGGGRLTVVAGVYRAPVANITDVWLSDSEDIVVVKDAPRTDVVNIYRPTIANAEEYIEGSDISRSTPTTYTVTPLPEVRSAAFIVADGQELPREITFGGVTRLVHAQHICGVMMRDARDGLILRLPCNLRAWQLELFDVVTVTLPFFGFEAKLFEVIGWKYSVDNGVVLTLKETAASIYDPDSGLSVLNAAENSTLPLPWVVNPLTGLNVTSGTVALTDGTSQTRTLVSWDESGEESVLQSGKIEVQYIQMLTATFPTEWPSWIEEGSATNATIPGLLAGQPYVFRARAINTLGVKSAWSTQVAHIITSPTPLIKVWRQATAPTTGAHDGDVWFDTDDGNAMYMLDSGSWVSVKDADIAAAGADAAAALAVLASIASDNMLTPGEKPTVILDNTVILAEQAGIDAKATAQAITTEKTAYDTAVTALTDYLATLTTPVLWSDLSGNTTIVGTTLRSKFADVYAARQTLLNLIAVKIADGAVGTPQLGNEAATVTMTGESASGSTNLSNVVITSVSWTNNTGVAVTVQAEYAVDAVKTGTGAGSSFVSYVFSVPTGSSAAYTSPQVGATEVSLAKVIQRTVPAGDTATVSMEAFATALSGTYTLDWRRAVVRLTAIKK